MATQPGKKKEVKKVKRPTAIKRDLQAEKARIRNRVRKAKAKTAIRRLDESVVAQNGNATQTSLNDVYSVLDKAGKVGLFKKNKVNRLKSRIAKRAAKAAK